MHPGIRPRHGVPISGILYTTGAANLAERGLAANEGAMVDRKYRYFAVKLEWREPGDPCRKLNPKLARDAGTIPWLHEDNVLILWLG